MIPASISPRRRRARDLVRVGAALAAVMLVVSVVSALGSDRHVSAAGTNAGPLQVLVPPGHPTSGQPITSGGSATEFASTPPDGAACTGDTATGGYLIQSYIVPASIDPGTLTFDSSGPVPAGIGADLRQPLFSATGTPFVNVNTAIATTPGGGGLLANLTTISFAVFGADGPQFVPNGTYNVGYACTKGNPSATQQDKYWNVQLTFTADPNDVPSGITWTVTAPPAATTTTAAATTTSPGAATTIAPGATTTTAPGATTTTVSGATTTTAAGSGTTTTIRSSSAGGQSQSGSGSGTGSGTGGTIPTTGSSSPVPIVVWAILLLVLGRMAILLGRPIRVRPAERR